MTCVNGWHRATQKFSRLGGVLDPYEAMAAVVWQHVFSQNWTVKEWQSTKIALKIFLSFGKICVLGDGMEKPDVFLRLALIRLRNAEQVLFIAEVTVALCNGNLPRGIGSFAEEIRPFGTASGSGGRNCDAWKKPCEGYRESATGRWIGRTLSSRTCQPFPQLTFAECNDQPHHRRGPRDAGRAGELRGGRRTP